MSKRTAAWLGEAGPTAYVLALGLCAGACAETSAPVVDPRQTSRTISVLGHAPAPSRLRVRNGVVYWSEQSDVPLGRITIADGGYTPLVTAVPIPESAVSDGQYVYWVTGDRLLRTTLDGATTTVLDEGYRDGSSQVTATVVLDETNAYWANSGRTTACTPSCIGTIRRVPRAGGPAATLVTTDRPVLALAIADSQLFWEQEGAGNVLPDSSGGSSLRTVSVTGGPAATLVNGLLNGLKELDVWGTSWNPRGGLKADGGDVYFADTDWSTSYRVLRVSRSGGAVTVLAEVVSPTASSGVYDLVIDPSTVYWGDDVSVNAVPRAGGAPSELARTTDRATLLALRGGSLFWVEVSGAWQGTLKRVAVAGGSPEVLKTGIEVPAGLSADAAHLFWVEGGQFGGMAHCGRIARIAPDGSGETVLIESVVSAEGAPFDVDDRYVYFADAGSIKRVPITGGRPERLARTGDVAEVATDGEYVYLLGRYGSASKVSVDGGPVTILGAVTVTAAPERTPPSPRRSEVGGGQASDLPAALRLGGSWVYTMNMYGHIDRIPKDGGPGTTVFVPEHGHLTDFVVAGPYLVVAEWDAARIRRIGMNVGDTLTLAQLRTDQTRRLATDGVSVYWVDQTSVGKLRVAGGGLEHVAWSVASSPYAPNGLAVDDTRLFWTAVASGAILMAVPK